MDKTFFEIPDILSITYKPTLKKIGEECIDVSSSQIDLSDYIIPHIDEKDIPQINLYYQYGAANIAHSQSAEPVLAEKHVWVKKQLFNAPGVEKLYFYSVRDASGKLKQINNFYSIYPTLLKSEPALLIEGTLPVSWEYDRLIDIGKTYNLANTNNGATKFELARHFGSFASKAGKKTIRTDSDVIEIVYSAEGLAIRKEYFSRTQGLVSLVSIDNNMIKQSY